MPSKKFVESIFCYVAYDQDKYGILIFLSKFLKEVQQIGGVRFRRVHA